LHFPGTTNEKLLNEKLESQLVTNLQKINKYFPQYNWLSETYETKVLENTQYLLSIRLGSENIIIQPQTKTLHKSFNLRSGLPITLADVFQGSFISEIKKILNRKLKELYGNQQAFSTKDIFLTIEEMVKNYYFTTSGIVFYRDYQPNFNLANNAPLELTISYKELRRFLKPNALIKDFIK
jgi:hypothetical protein